VYQYVEATSAIASHRGIEEWLPPGTGVLVGAVWVASLLLVIVAIAKTRRRPMALEVCLLTAFLPFACSSTRMVAWWLLVSAPVLCGLLVSIVPRAADRDPPKPTALAAAFFAIIVSCSVLSLPCLGAINPLFGTIRSDHRTESDLAAIASELRQRPGGRIFSRLEWGEYFGWSLAPRDKVFIDGRIEIYPDSIWEQYLAITGARADWQRILDQYHVDYLILDQSYHLDLLPQVRQSLQWRQAAQRGDAVLFIRAEASSETE
jgi:hypothetical protein